MKRCTDSSISFSIAPPCRLKEEYAANLGSIVPSILIFSYAVTLSLIVTEVGALLIAGSPVVTPVIESIVGPICHHIPARTLFLPGVGLLPVCARCTGLYVGWILAGPVGLLLHKISCRHTSSLRLGVIFLLAVTFGGAAGALMGALGLLALSNATRFFFGLPLGLGPWSLALWGACVLKSPDR